LATTYNNARKEKEEKEGIRKKRGKEKDRGRLRMKNDSRMRHSSVFTLHIY